MDTIRVNSSIVLNSLHVDDDVKLYDYLHDGTIAKNFLLIPFPYSIDDAKAWIKYNLNLQSQKKVIFNYAIRDELADNMLIGSISIIDISVVSGLSEVTYWLAASYRGKGIMTNVLRSLCSSIKKYKNNDIAPYKYITTLYATVFVHNTASPKVLEKCQFQFEQTLLNFYYKDGAYIDAHKYTYELETVDTDSNLEVSGALKPAPQVISVPLPLPNSMQDKGVDDDKDKHTLLTDTKKNQLLTGNKVEDGNYKHEAFVEQCDNKFNDSVMDLPPNTKKRKINS